MKPQVKVKFLILVILFLILSSIVGKTVVGTASFIATQGTIGEGFGKVFSIAIFLAVGFLWFFDKPSKES